MPKEQKKKGPGRPRGSGGKARELSSDEIKRVDRCFGGRFEDRNRALFWLGLGTGMRISEILSLRLGDVAPNGNPPEAEIVEVIRLDGSRTKNKQPREVVITKQSRRKLRDWLEQRDPDEPREYPLFASYLGASHHMTSGGAAMLFHKVFRLAGIHGASTHSLRRTHANRLRRAGVDLVVIMRQLGHKSLSTTQKYLGVDPVEQQEAIDPLKL